MSVPVRSEHLSRLLAGHDEKAYRLPAPILQIRAAADRIAALPVEPPPPTEQAVWSKITAGAVAAFLGGESELPDPLTPIKEARDGLARCEASQKMRSEVAWELERTLATVVAHQTDVIITGSLQPALAEVVGQVEKAVSVLPDRVNYRPPPLTAPAVQRRAWVSLEECATRYGVIRTGWDALGVPAGSDETGEFRELANQDQVWRRSEHWRVAASRRPPWPDDPPARLAWLVAHRAVLIAPTAAEPSHVEGEVRRPHHAAEEGPAKRGGFRGGAGPDLRRTSACFKQGLVLALALSGFDQCTNDRRACRCTALRRSVPPSRQAEGA